MSEKSQTPPVVLLQNLVGEFIADAEAAQRARESGRPRGPVTGIRRLDEILGSYLVPGLHVLQGAPGCGKTAMALQIASDCAFPTLYVSCEMPLLELFRRLVSRQTSTFLGKLKSGETSGVQARQLALATIEKLPHIAFMDGTRMHADVKAIVEAAEGLRDSMNAEHVVVVVDSLTVWARAAARDSLEMAGLGEYELINAGVSGCVNVATALSAPVLALSHRNRAGQEKGGLHAAKGSGAIEYESETVLDLVPAEKEQQPDATGETKIKLIAVKNRNGIPNIPVNLRFCGRLQSFREDGN